MEALFSYVLARVAFKLIVLELIVLSFALLAIVIIKFYYQQKRFRETRIQQKLSELIRKGISSEKSAKDFKIPNHLLHFQLLLKIIEEFNKRISDHKWIEIHNHLLETYLFKKVKNYAQSRSWMKRQLAARCYLLRPSMASENDLAKLLRDQKYLVRIVAAECITKISNKELFYEVIKTMSHESKLARFPYRDALIQIDDEKFQWIEELVQTKPEPPLSTVCLDLLSTRTSRNLFNLVLPYFYKKDRENQIEAIKILKNIPTTESSELLLLALQDGDWEIRAEAIKGLAFLRIRKAIPKLEFLLEDPIWFVRLQAAIALKTFGAEGIEILSRQVMPNATEISKYVLALPV